jgi:hypothetical protein
MGRSYSISWALTSIRFNLDKRGYRGGGDQLTEYVTYKPDRFGGYVQAGVL